MPEDYDQYDDPQYYEDHIEEATWYADSYPQDVEAITCRQWVETIRETFKTRNEQLAEFAKLTRANGKQIAATR